MPTCNLSVPAMRFNVSLIRGQTYRFRLTVTAGGVPMNLTGYTFAAAFCPGTFEGGATGAALFTLTSGGGFTLTDATGGVVDGEISATNSALFAANQATDSNGSPPYVFDVVATAPDASRLPLARGETYVWQGVTP